MKRIFKFITLFIWLSEFMNFSAFSQETVTITTYYPTPFGAYNRLVTGTLGVDSSSDLTDADAPDPATQSGDIWIIADLGIGTTNPQSTLSVAGSAAIGATYAGINAAPANGLLVQGDVGVGLGFSALAPAADLEAEAIRLVPTSFDSRPAPLVGQNLTGSLYYCSNCNPKGLRFHDGTDWKVVGSLALSANTTSVSSIELFRQENFPITLTANCPANSVVTGVRLNSAGACPSDCGFNNGRIKRLTVICRELQ